MQIIEHKSTIDCKSNIQILWREWENEYWSSL